MKEQKSGTRATGTITISRAEYEELKSQNEWLLEQLRLANKKRFGASSEQTKEQLDGQLSLTFNEAEAYAAPPGPKKVAQVAAHTRKQSGSVKDVAPEAIAHIMAQKFVMYVPLYRQEQEWGRQRLELSRQTMSNWVLRAAEDWLGPVYDVLHRRLVLREVLHADETTLQVLREPGKKAQSKSYMWLYRTGGDGGVPIVLYEYQPSRKAEHAEKFLEGFSGHLHADGHQGYHRLPENIRVVGRWAHARRKFDEALNALPPDKREGAAAYTGLDYCNKLFAWEERFKELSPEERTKQRLKEEKPLLDALLAWADSISGSAAPKSALGKALYYLKEQWTYLIRYLEDGRLELSNNRAERSIKPFVIGRKNFLFADSPLGPGPAR